MNRDELVEYARSIGLCGEPFAHHGVCDMEPGHPPIAAPHWMHGEDIGGPVDRYRMAQYVSETYS